MDTVMLSNGIVFDATSISTKSVEVDGTYVKAVVLTISGASLDDIKDQFNTPSNVSSFTYVTEGNKSAKTYAGYQKLKTISIDPDKIVEGSEEYVVTMARTSDVKELISAWEKTLDAQTQDIANLRSDLNNTDETLNNKLSDVTKANGELLKSVDKHNELIDTLSDTVNSAIETKEYVPETLEEAISMKIEESKAELAKFLASHPILSTCHDEAGAYYSVTAEKQQYLTSMISIATLAKSQGIEYQCSWNAVGSPCTYDWTIEQLQQLALEIAEFVRPLVSQQQKYEVDIKNYTDKDSLLKLKFNYVE